MKRKNIWLTSSLAAAFLLSACNTAEEETKDEPLEEEARPIEETIDESEPVRDEETTDEQADEAETVINDPADEQTPVTDEEEQGTEGTVTDAVGTEEDTSATTEVDEAAATPQTAVDVSKKKANEVIIYTSDANAEQVIPTKAVTYQYKTNGPITKFVIDQLGYGQYYNKHTVSADEKTIMIDFNDSILSSNLVQGSAGGLMFERSVVASIFENIPQAQVVKLRVNGKEEVLDHVSFAGQITRAQFEQGQ